MSTDEAKEGFAAACSPRRKIRDAQMRDREIAAQLEADAKGADAARQGALACFGASRRRREIFSYAGETDDAAQSKDAKDGAKDSKDGMTSTEFAFGFVRSILFNTKR